MGVVVTRELAFAKVNLVLHVGRPRGDGLHPVCSILASVELADTLEVEPSPAGRDSVECPGVREPNLAAAAVAAFRRRVPSLPPLQVTIEKRIPVAAGLGGGSADAAAVLRAANRIAERSLSGDALREMAAGLGSDVASQIEARHTLVQGVGELVEPVELPPWAVVLVPQQEGLSTATVYAQLDRMKGWRERLDPRPLREFARSPDLRALENDLEPAALSLRPELARVLEHLRQAGALAARITGSGSTAFGVFADRGAAEAAAEGIDGALVTALRGEAAEG